MFDAVMIDLDGTLVDCAARHYACYAQISAQMRLPLVARETYWAMKRRRASWASLLQAAAAPACAAQLERRFVDNIETAGYLELDRLVPDAMEALRAVRECTRSLVLVTMRRQAGLLQEQIARLGIAALFDQVVCRGVSGAERKDELAARALPASARELAWIGDTEEDIAAARRVRALACAVYSGFRERVYLEAQRPDLVAATLGELVPLLRERAP